MECYSATYFFALLFVQRGLALIYALAFLVAYNQFPALHGDRGLEPTAGRLAERGPFWSAPSIFYYHYSDAFFRISSACGLAISCLLFFGVADKAPLWLSMLLWLLPWILYLSIKNAAGTFYGFGWETKLLDAGFLAIFLGPAHTHTPLVLVFLLRWLLFRVELGAGLIKMRGDRCWRDLSCMDYHHETQPIPNRLSWVFHHAPATWHRVETLGNHVVQLGVVWLIFAPQPIASIAGAAIIFTQLWLMQSGNYSWLNALTIVVALSTVSDQVLHSLLGWDVPSLAAAPLWFECVAWGVAVLVGGLSIPVVRNLASSRQRMNISFNPFHIVGSYGAFGSVTRERHELVIEGSPDAEPNESAEWREYEMKAKPGKPSRAPRQVAPYHLRLDWQLWFLPLRPFRQPRWLLVFVGRLLKNDRATLSLIGENPFPAQPPRWIRISLYHYRFALPEERKKSGDYWVRTYLNEYLPPVGVAEVDRVLDNHAA